MKDNRVQTKLLAGVSLLLHPVFIGQPQKNSKGSCRHLLDDSVCNNYSPQCIEKVHKMLVRQAVLYDLEMVALTKRKEAEMEKGHWE